LFDLVFIREEKQTVTAATTFWASNHQFTLADWLESFTCCPTNDRTTEKPPLRRFSLLQLCSWLPRRHVLNLFTFSLRCPHSLFSPSWKRPLPIHSVCHILQCMLEGKWKVRLMSFPSAYPRIFLILWRFG